jgi:hypothetical protein
MFAIAVSALLDAVVAPLNAGDPGSLTHRIENCRAFRPFPEPDCFEPIS